MNLAKLTTALNQLPLAGSYSMCKIVSYEDDQKPDFWYFMLIDRQMQYPGTYVNMHGQLSATFLLDPTLKSLAVQALFTLDNKTGDVTSHFVGYGKLHLPGISNSSGMKYGIVDIELSVSQFLQHLPTSKSCPAVAMASMTKQSVEFVPISLQFGSRCDCGGHKLGYKDDELHGHARWCKLVAGDTSSYKDNGNGD